MTYSDSFIIFLSSRHSYPLLFFLEGALARSRRMAGAPRPQRRKLLRFLSLIAVLWVVVVILLRHPQAADSTTRAVSSSASKKRSGDILSGTTVPLPPDPSASNRRGNNAEKDEGENESGSSSGSRDGENSENRGDDADGDNDHLVFPDEENNPAALFIKIPKPPPDDGNADVDRLSEVVAAIRHSWDGYKAYAWGHDEYLPISKQKRNWGGGHGIGATIIDALDTLIIAGMKKESREAIKWIEGNLTFNQNIKLSVFETTIRILGGLLSAYELTGQPVLLERARDLGNRLLPAFETSSGLPDNYINLVTNAHEGAQWNAFGHILSEFGSLQLEFRTLSHLTGDPKYDRAARKALEIIRPQCIPGGMCPGVFHGRSPGGNTAGLGSFGDSFYEYLLKQWLLTGKTEAFFEKWWDQVADHILKSSSVIRGLTIPNGGTRMEHLACFSAGLFALSYHNTKIQDHLDIAQSIALTCHEMYLSAPSGLAPDVAVISNFGSADRMFRVQDPKYILRPETVESYFYLWRVTKDKKYRDWGADVLQACNKYLKVPDGYVGTSNVMSLQPPHHDMMETFWLGETLKYLYLLFADDSVINIDEVVFNTEAHPLKIWVEAPQQTEAQQQGNPQHKAVRRHA